MISKAPYMYHPPAKGSASRGEYEPEPPTPRPITAPIQLAGGDFANQCENRIDGAQCARRKKSGSPYCGGCGKLIVKRKR